MIFINLIFVMLFVIILIDVKQKKNIELASNAIMVFILIMLLKMGSVYISGDKSPYLGGKWGGHAPIFYLSSGGWVQAGAFSFNILLKCDDAFE